MYAHRAGPGWPATASVPEPEPDPGPRPEVDESTRELPLGEESLGRLLLALRPRLAAVALRFTRDPEAAEDVVQNAYEKAIKNRDRFRGEARVSTWLHRIVANEALMWLRSERRRARRVDPLGEEDVEQIVDPAPDALDRIDSFQRSHRLRAGIARLAPDERDVIEGCVLLGRSYGDYGRDRGLHPAAAKSRAFRARRRLHAMLAD